MMGLYRSESGIATIGWMKSDVWFRNITQTKDYSPRILQHFPTGLWASDLGFANAPSVSGLRGARLPLASGMWAPRSYGHLSEFGGDAHPKPKHPNTLFALVISGYQTDILEYTVIHFPERRPPRNCALVDESTGIRWTIATKIAFFFSSSFPRNPPMDVVNHHKSPMYGSVSHGFPWFSTVPSPHISSSSRGCAMVAWC